MTPDITLEDYEEKRKEIVKANANLLGIIMSEEEKKLDTYLTSLKSDFNKTVGGKNIYRLSPLSDPSLRNSKLYQFCENLPKGADLHVHDMALLPFPELVRFLITCPEFCINTDRSSYDLIEVEPGQAVPNGYMRFFEAVQSGFYSEHDLMINWTIVGAQASDMNAWDYFELLFNRHTILSNNPAFSAKYYDYAFRYYCNHHIMHVEIHLMLTESIDESEDYLKAIRQAYYAVKKEYPYFTVRIIGAGVKSDNDRIEMTKKCFLNTSYVRETIKDESDPNRITDFVIGFDLVNEEDSSLPLHAFVPMLLKVKKQYPGMKLYIHSGESFDLGNENLIDAYLLGATRVGHGLNLYRFPDLHARFAKAEICLEVCPISNQALGYTEDIRSHPATEYLRSGVPLALCSDDATYMEFQTLTDDFFSAVIGWNLGISEIKQLAINSILYSGLDNEEKYRSLRSYREMWDQFVKSSLKDIG